MTVAKKTDTSPTLKVVEAAAAPTAKTASPETSGVAKAVDPAPAAAPAPASKPTGKEGAPQPGAFVPAGFDDLMSLSRSSADAVVASTTILAQGWQDMTSAFFAYTQKAVERSLDHSKAVSSAKSVHELIDVHQSFATAGLDDAVAQLTRLSDMNVAVLEKAAKPLAGTVEVAVQTLLKPAAA